MSAVELVRGIFAMFSLQSMFVLLEMSHLGSKLNQTSRPGPFCSDQSYIVAGCQSSLFESSMNQVVSILCGISFYRVI